MMTNHDDVPGKSVHLHAFAIPDLRQTKENHGKLIIGSSWHEPARHAKVMPSRSVRNDEQPAVVTWKQPPHLVVSNFNTSGLAAQTLLIMET